jgi:hypothetical protein
MIHFGHLCPLTQFLYLAIQQLVFLIHCRILCTRNSL